MRIGIDFDNTIACYDRLFHQLAAERGLIDGSTPATKTAVRDELRHHGHEEAWTALQGEAYGQRINEATPFPGVAKFIGQCLRAGHRVNVVSHRTLQPFAGPPCDLHAAARGWLRQHGLLGREAGSGVALCDDDVFFELTKADKLSRIADLRCDCFIDDLPEFLSDADFPGDVDRLLFDPHDRHEGSGVYRRFQAWADALPLMPHEEPVP